MFQGPIKKHDDAQPKSNEVPTPHGVCRWLYQTISPVLRPRTILDPCAGDGRLTQPWQDADPDLLVHSFEINRGKDFLQAQAIPGIDLVVMNPPFAVGGPNLQHKHAPEEFLRQVFRVAGEQVPVAMLAPVGFRLNTRRSGKRLNWISGLEITSIVSLPHDCFSYPDGKPVLLACEILFLNMPSGLKAHYTCLEKD